MLDMLLSNMADADLNARMKALTDEKASLKEQILETQQEEVGLEEQVAKRQQMWDSLIECSEGYTEFDDEFSGRSFRRSQSRTLIRSVSNLETPISCSSRDYNEKEGEKRWQFL